MKWAALMLLGGSLVLTVAVPASGGRRQASATPVQKAETCTRAAIRKEDLAGKYIKEGTLSNAAIDGVIEAAVRDLKCAASETSHAYGADDISQTESGTIRFHLNWAERHDASAISAKDKAHRLAYLDSASMSKMLALDDLEEATAPPATTTTTTTGSSTSPSANPQNPCNNQNHYDPKFPDYTQLHEYCGKGVTAFTIHSSVSMNAGGWYGPIIAGVPPCSKPDPKTANCTNLTAQLPKLTAFIVYASHPGGWPPGDTASVTFSFNDGTKQTEIFWPH